MSRKRFGGAKGGGSREELAVGEAVDLVVVLAGGVDASGRPHETVLRRLRAAARLNQAAAAIGRALPILCNGGGTTHKPKWVDEQGYSVPEAALMARHLAQLGVPYDHIYLEGYSDDTLGNAFQARTLTKTVSHTKPALHQAAIADTAVEAHTCAARLRRALCTRTLALTGAE